VFGKRTVFIRSGGSIPIVGDFPNHLGIPAILMGFGLPDDCPLLRAIRSVTRAFLPVLVCLVWASVPEVR
jgi:hypothetical protein